MILTAYAPYFGFDATYWAHGCPAGHVTTRFVAESVWRCIACALGTFSNDVDTQTPCALCPAGTFAAFNGSTACSQCATGTFQDQRGQSSCKLCGDFGFPSPCPPDPTVTTAQLGGSSFLISLALLSSVASAAGVVVFKNNRVIFTASPFFLLLLLGGSAVFGELLPLRCLLNHSVLVCSGCWHLACAAANGRAVQCEAVAGSHQLSNRVWSIVCQDVPSAPHLQCAYLARYPHSHRCASLADNPILRALKIPSAQLLLGILALVACDVIVLALWTVRAPFALVNPTQRECVSSVSLSWSLAVFSLRVLLQESATFLPILLAIKAALLVS